MRDADEYTPLLTSDCGSAEDLRAVDSNLSSLCQHVQTDGWNVGAFSDIVIECMGATFKLHKLILSRSSYFRHMLQGPWKEASALVVTLQIDDENIDTEAVTIALSYLYGHYPKLNDTNAFRVLAAASFLDLQDLCAICTDFIISEIWSSNFLIYQAFAERQDYGVYGDRVRKACWGYLCRGGAMELREILPKLSTQTLCALLTSDELWVPNEEKRFELALNVFLAKGYFLEIDQSACSNALSSENCFPSDSTIAKEETRQLEISNEKMEHIPESPVISKCSCFHKKFDDQQIANEILAELADSVVDGHCTAGCEVEFTCANQKVRYSQDTGTNDMHKNTNLVLPNQTHMEANLCDHCSKSRKGPDIRRRKDRNRLSEETAPIEGQNFSFEDQTLQNSKSKSTLTERNFSYGWGRAGSQAPSWGGRIVSRKQIRAYPRENECIQNEELDAILNVFESGGIFYCHMTFEGLLNVRKQLEELGFLCKSACDGLWLQMLLKNQVLTVSSETCKSCSLSRPACRCRQNYDVLSHGRVNDSIIKDIQQRLSGAGSVGSLYTTEASGANSSAAPPRVRVRATMDGLAGIGRGSTLTSEDVTWPPQRVVFSRVPYGLGGRNSQNAFANEQSEGRLDLGEVEFQRDGLTVAVGPCQGFGNGAPIHSDQTPRNDEHLSYCRTSRDAIGPTSSGSMTLQRVEAQHHPLGQEWETSQDSPIALDLQTPLRDFPPFRFGVEFEDVHRLCDGQAKHSSEVFYAGSLWKVSVQAFNDEDPQGRRTLGLFLHRRKADIGDAQQRVHLYIDTREKVTVRYQLICPSKREVMVFGSLAQSGTLLPKAPKGWGWRTALLFDELPDLLQGGSLRVAAVIQIV